MEQQSIFINEFEEKEKKGSINVLTILTFIGCGLLFILSFVGFFFSDKSYQAAEDLVSSGKVEQMPSFLQGNYSPEKLEILRLTAANKVPILIIYLISTGLCLFGAIQMRKLKADGYWIWLIGEILPYPAVAFFVGWGSLVGLGAYFAYAVIGVFIILYSVQKKHLTK